MSETLNETSMEYVYKYPWRGSQYATVAAAGILTIIFGTFMLVSSGGNPIWWVIIALAPFASVWSWRTNVSRKNRSAVSVSVKNGKLRCTSEANDDSTGTVDLSELDDVYVAEFSGKDILALVQGENRARIPLRAVGEGSPLVPLIRNAATVRNVHVSKDAKEILGL